MNTALIQGSIGAIAKRDGMSLAESFVNCDAVIICDVSGSMADRDSRGGRKRYDVAVEELSRLQNTMPGKLAVIAFSDGPVFCPNGMPPFLGSGTDLLAALKFAKMADMPDMRFIIISDGQPENGVEALRFAATFEGRIDTVFVGPESDRVSRGYMANLANARGGQAVLAAQAKQLATTIERLLLTDGA